MPPGYGNIYTWPLYSKSQRSITDIGLCTQEPALHKPMSAGLFEHLYLAAILTSQRSTTQCSSATTTKFIRPTQPKRLYLYLLCFPPSIFRCRNKPKTCSIFQEKNYLPYLHEKTLFALFTSCLILF